MNGMEADKLRLDLGLSVVAFAALIGEHESNVRLWACLDVHESGMLGRAQEIMRIAGVLRRCLGGAAFRRLGDEIKAAMVERGPLMGPRVLLNEAAKP